MQKWTTAVKPNCYYMPKNHPTNHEPNAIVPEVTQWFGFLHGSVGQDLPSQRERLRDNSALGSLPFHCQ